MLTTSAQDEPGDLLLNVSSSYFLLRVFVQCVYQVLQLKTVTASTSFQTEDCTDEVPFSFDSTAKPIMLGVN